MQLNDVRVRVSACNLYSRMLYAPYTTKYTSLVRLIFSSLILSFCSVSWYFVSIPYAVCALVVVLGVFRLRYILDCCMSSSSSFFFSLSLMCLCLVNRVVVAAVAVADIVVVVNAAVVVIIVATAIIVAVTVYFDAYNRSKWDTHGKPNAPIGRTAHRHTNTY